MFPVEEKNIPRFTRKQIEDWAKSPEIQSLAGALKTADLPAEVSLSDIRKVRLEEKYKI